MQRRMCWWWCTLTCSCVVLSAWIVTGCSAGTPTQARRQGGITDVLPSLATAHGIAIYVNPLSCKLTTKDIDDLRTIDSIAGVSTAIIWLIPPGNDSSIVQPLRNALRLDALDQFPVRQEFRMMKATSVDPLPDVVVFVSREVRATFRGDLGWSIRMAKLTLTSRG